MYGPVADLKHRYFLYQIRPQFGSGRNKPKNVSFTKMFEAELKALGLEGVGKKKARRQTPGDRTRAFLAWAKAADTTD